MRPFPGHENCVYNERGFTCKVPPGNYLMMGDNVANSHDSRAWVKRTFELKDGRKIVCESQQVNLGRAEQSLGEYAKGLEGLLLKAQENDRLGIDLEVKQKLVRSAELEAEALKMRHVKEAEGRAQITVLEAKAQADAMQHTLPLKEKQIQQSRLEAEARKEATVKNAEAAAAAKVIDSKAELEKRNLLSQADAQRVRVMAVADAERLKSEAQVLKESPLLIQKIVAERLSDKVQIMMVPMDGKFFFTNDVLKTMPIGGLGTPQFERH